MKLYTSTFAPNPRKIETLIKAKGLSIDDINNLEVVFLDIGKGEHQTPEFKKINPLGLLPVLVLEDGTVLNDSQAICKYLDAVLEGDSLMGSDIVHNAKITAMTRNAEFHVMYNMMIAFQHGHPARAVTNRQVTGMSEDSIRRVIESLPYFDHILKDNDYLVNNQLSLADIVLYLGLDFGRINKFKPNDAAVVGENVARFYERIHEKFGLKRS